MEQAMQQQTETVVNGVNVTELFNTIDAIKGEPKIANFSFRATNKWVNGAGNQTIVKDFDGACQTIDREHPFVIQKDEHPILLGQDTGANPVEYALAALAGCLTTSLVYHAAAKGIKLDEVESTYSGDINLHGFLGLDDTVRNGYEGITVSFKVKGDATEEQLKELVEIAQQRSPVFDIVTNKVPVSVRFES
jgi:uncharacterized OsmC-like protein